MPRLPQLKADIPIVVQDEFNGLTEFERVKASIAKCQRRGRNGSLFGRGSILDGYPYRWLDGGVGWMEYVYNVSRGEPIISIVALLFAGAIWLAGLACRYLLTVR